VLPTSLLTVRARTEVVPFLVATTAVHARARPPLVPLLPAEPAADRPPILPDPVPHRCGSLVRIEQLAVVTPVHEATAPPWWLPVRSSAHVTVRRLRTTFLRGRPLAAATHATHVPADPPAPPESDEAAETSQPRPHSEQPPPALLQRTPHRLNRHVERAHQAHKQGPGRTQTNVPTETLRSRSSKTAPLVNPEYLVHQDRTSDLCVRPAVHTRPTLRRDSHARMTAGRPTLAARSTSPARRRTGCLPPSLRLTRL
jgi:hypothetical protein